MIGAAIVLIIIAIVIVIIIVSTEEKKLVTATFLITMALCLIIAGLVVGYQGGEGKPIGAITSTTIKDDLPPENTPMNVTAVSDTGETYDFLLAQNNGEKAKFYRIPKDTISPGTNLSVGVKIINIYGEIQNPK